MRDPYFRKSVVDCLASFDSRPKNRHEAKAWQGKTRGHERTVLTLAFLRVSWITVKSLDGASECHYVMCS